MHPTVRVCLSVIRTASHSNLSLHPHMQSQVSPEFAPDRGVLLGHVIHSAQTKAATPHFVLISPRGSARPQQATKGRAASADASRQRSDHLNPTSHSNQLIWTPKADALRYLYDHPMPPGSSGVWVRANIAGPPYRTVAASSFSERCATSHAGADR